MSFDSLHGCEIVSATTLKGGCMSSCFALKGFMGISGNCNYRMLPRTRQHVDRKGSKHLVPFLWTAIQTVHVAHHILDYLDFTVSACIWLT
jgi:hypothetical protein